MNHFTGSRPRVRINGIDIGIANQVEWGMPRTFKAATYSTEYGMPHQDIDRKFAAAKDVTSRIKVKDAGAE